MTREEMLRRLDRKEDPFEISIKKWEDIWLGISAISNGNNCALCHLFAGHHCKYCPIFRYTRKRTCHNTPFEKFVEHHSSCDMCGPLRICDKGRELAEKEVKFLKKLDKW